jgi:hypothetical protein
LPGLLKSIDLANQQPHNLQPYSTLCFLETDKLTSQPFKMGDVVVENPANTVAPHKKQSPADSIPTIDSLEGSSNDSGDEYSTLKRYQRHLE